ncbi:hypothetical protein Poli38472_004460 [Pythium oligandrum]|uniref:Uncharacterized protein n=1 Tax=Pythium oligandrum TaxID=41045 RepID=A0A8K1C9Y4_PYTOL|nr:hypothetical protein Poli38472_004460 [Pythium oligandrum]|eukprot:TMW59391.1 hypothetical protein Poli38472_004460 [Pythium oligandrum]
MCPIAKTTPIQLAPLDPAAKSTTRKRRHAAVVVCLEDDEATWEAAWNDAEAQSSDKRCRSDKSADLSCEVTMMKASVVTIEAQLSTASDAMQELRDLLELYAQQQRATGWN